MNLYPIVFALGVSLACFPAHSALAADVAGMIKTVKGSAHIHRGGRPIPATVGTEVFTSDRIVTEAASSVGLTLRDGTLFALGPASTLDLNKFSFNSTTHAGALDATVRRGSLSVISGKVAKANPDAVRFNTATVTLGVRGTEFIIEAGSAEEQAK